MFGTFMLEEIGAIDNTESNAEALAQDTALPRDLYEALLLEKQRRQQTLATRQKILTFFVSWTFHASGTAIAKWCLVLGGSSAYWLAATLCFTVALVPATFMATSININYIEGQMEATNLERGGGVLIKAVGAGVTTWLAVKEHQFFAKASDDAIAQIEQQVRVVQKQHPESYPWLPAATPLLVALAVGLVVGVFVRR